MATENGGQDRGAELYVIDKNVRTYYASIDILETWLIQSDV